MLVQTAYQTVKLVQPALNCKKLALVLFRLVIGFCLPAFPQFLGKSLFVRYHTVGYALNGAKHQLIKRFLVNIMDCAV